MQRRNVHHEGVPALDYRQIYTSAADQYDELVQAEDCGGNLIPAIHAIQPLDSASVLEVGVGTGRIACAIVKRVSRFVAVDLSPAMLKVARRRLATIQGRASMQLICADARELPVKSGWADVAIAGWVFGHFLEWMADDWRRDVERGINEMRRALRPGGVIVLVETLGTGREEPAAPTPELDEYFRWIETEQKFERSTIRTDYRFPDVGRAVRMIRFFFGDDLAERVQRERWTRVPECTGIWRLRT